MTLYKYWYIKERINPQLGTYYIPLGNISCKSALEHKKTLYGENRILRFETEERYLKMVAELKDKQLIYVIHEGWEE